MAQQTLAELRTQLATQTAQPTGSTASQQLLDAEAEVEELRRRLVVQKTAVALVPSRMIGSKEADPRLSQRDYRPSAKRRKRSPPVEAEVLAVLPPGPVAPGGTDATLVVLLVITAAVILASS